MEEELDSLIKNYVEDHKEPFNEHHWELLTEEIQRRKIRTIIKRSAEVLIILLLILTTQNFLQLKNSTTADKSDQPKRLRWQLRRVFERQPSGDSVVFLVRQHGTASAIRIRDRCQRRGKVARRHRSGSTILAR